MIIETTSVPLTISNPGGNITAASITFPVPTLTIPTGDGVINLGLGGQMTANGLFLIPYGAGSAAQTFTMAVYAWHNTLGYGGAKQLWVAAELATFTCTLCTVPGLAGADVNASQLFCGTIALGVGNANVSNEILSPTGNVVAHILLDVKGAKLVEIRFGTGSSATSCNCLYKRI